MSATSPSAGVPPAQRQLSSVSVTSLEASHDPEGVHFISGVVRASFTNYLGEADGPGFSIFLSTPFDPAGSLLSAERALLSRALEFLKRGASFSLDEFQAVFEADRQKAEAARKENPYLDPPGKEL